MRALSVLMAFGVVMTLLSFLRAQSGATPAPTNAAPASAPADTNAAPAAPAAPAATNSAPTEESTNSAPLNPAASTNAVPGPAAAPNAPAEEEGPPSPGAMSQPGSELIGPPAPVQAAGPLPTDNPAVTDVTNNPDAVEGLGRRKLPFYFGFDLGEMYDDNILIQPDGQKQSAFITHMAPSLDYQMGEQTEPHSNYLNLYFSPEVFIYDNRGRYDRINYNGDIYYQYTWTRLSIGVDENYQYLTDPTIDKGGLVTRSLYNTKITGSYLYNDDLTLYGTATQSINAYTGFTLNEWDLDTYALYQIAPKLSIGAGPRFSWLDIQNAPNETQQALLLRLRYLPDQAFTVTFDGGVQYLQYQGDTADRVLPVFDANVTYSPVQDTGLFLDASRSTVESYDLQGDTITVTAVQAGVGQHFLQKFNATALVGYNLSDYNQTSSSAGSTQREDNYYYAKGILTWDPNQYLDVALSYQWSNNNSSDAQSTFSDNQVDLQSTVKF